MHSQLEICPRCQRHTHHPDRCALCGDTEAPREFGRVGSAVLAGLMGLGVAACGDNPPQNPVNSAVTAPDAAPAKPRPVAPGPRPFVPPAPVYGGPPMPDPGPAPKLPERIEKEPVEAVPVPDPIAPVPLYGVPPRRLPENEIKPIVPQEQPK